MLSSTCSIWSDFSWASRVFFASNFRKFLFGISFIAGGTGFLSLSGSVIWFWGLIIVVDSVAIVGSFCCILNPRSLLVVAKFMGLNREFELLLGVPTTAKIKLTSQWKDYCLCSLLHRRLLAGYSISGMENGTIFDEKLWIPRSWRLIGLLGYT